MRLAKDYLSARDAGSYERAYALLAPQMKEGRPFAEFRKHLDAFNDRAGVVKDRRIKKITWYSSPPVKAPLPGVYVAVDLASKFENIDRHCGYLIVHQQSAGTFLIMREEENFMDHDTERRIRAESSQANVEKVWAQLARFCP